MTPIRVLARLENSSRSPYLAESVDGLWRYHWEEMPGTPWRVEYRPTGQSVYFGSLRAARTATADGHAMQQLVYDCEALLNAPTTPAAEQSEAQRRLTVYREVMTQNQPAPPDNLCRTTG
ncbi:hypothetical protein ACQSSU_20640 [Micromonospora echinospora]